MQSQPTAIGPGAVLGGDFRIERPLGMGGMGSVYLAQQISTGKARAVKVMHPGLVSSPGMRDRFIQEARIGSMIPSDHVVEVVGAGVDADSGVPWLAMELLNGEDLSQHLARRGALSVEELVSVMRPVFHALSAAHRQQIVHRDIKPENIFLATAQSSTAATVVKVLDFGIAKVAAQALGTATSAMGTPLWMAPEQTEQQAHLSPATDVWALALLVFCALVGKPYWRTAQSGGGSVPQLMREVLFEPMVPASERARELSPGLVLPAGFDAWFARSTTRDPAHRYPDASAAGVDLFTKVFGVSASVSVTNPSTLPSATMPTGAPALGLPSASTSSGVLPARSSGVLPATSATAGSDSNAGKIALLAIGLIALFGIGFVLVLGVGGLLWFQASDSETSQNESARTAQAPDPVEESAPPTAAPPAAAPPTAAPPTAAPPTADPPTADPPTTDGVPQKPVVAGGPTASATAPEVPPPDPAADKPTKAAYSVGQKVDVQWGGSWWQGQITAAKNDRYLIHYIGWASSWDEWVTTARLRPWTGTARGR
jgi:serine/threonine protein kinase